MAGTRRQTYFQYHRVTVIGHTRNPHECERIQYATGLISEHKMDYGSMTQYCRGNTSDCYAIQKKLWRYMRKYRKELIK